MDQYKYVGNLFSEIVRPNGDIFSRNYEYLCAQARKAVFKINRQLTNASPTPPALMLKLFNSSVKPILTFGSDIWGIYNTAHNTIDIFHRTFLKHILCVKSSTCNSFVYGETGELPISIDLSVFAIRYYHRLYNMPKGSLVKLAFDEMAVLSGLGFSTWVTKLQDVISKNNLDGYLSLPAKKFGILVKNKFRDEFLSGWSSSLTAPSARTYIRFNNEVKIAPFLYLVKIFKHRKSIAQLRCSSHRLSVETGRWSGIDLNRRLCPSCKVLDDEEHFVSHCRINKKERATLHNFLFLSFFDRDIHDFQIFRENLFVNLMTSTNECVLRAFGRFCYHSFNTRAIPLQD